MRLLASWVRDFVDVTASVSDIAETLGFRGFEVASIEALGEGDGVIDFEVTANRPDCLSVLGFAREIATAYDLPLRIPSAEPGAIALAHVPIGDSDRVQVTIEDAGLCPRYAAAVADVVPARTPPWMAARLHAAGVRPISPLVDITNYVLMELGHPMHAFDLAALAGAELRIRRASPGERITTLDGLDRPLAADMLVIADAQRAQAVAGVMGGATSEVSAVTRTVVFESACFKPSSVRRTSRQLGLKTEASARFERGADVGAPVVALQRAIALMQQVGAGTLLGPVVDRYPVPPPPIAIRLSRDKLAALLGLRVPDPEVERILRRLGLAVASTADGWRVDIPTFRVDLRRDVDLVEEVGRHYGFDRIEPAFPALVQPAPAEDPRTLRDRLIRQVLTGAGLSEAVTFGFIERQAAQAFADADAIVAVANPLSAKFDVLRPSLLPGLVDAVAHNLRHGRHDVALFEIGSRFTAARETRGLGIVWSGTATGEHWSGPPRAVDFFDLKGVLELVCHRLGVALTPQPAEVPYFVVGQTARLLADGVAVGIVGRVAPAIVESRGAPRQDPVFAAELDLDLLATRPGSRMTRVQPLPRHPFVVRDLSIVVASTLPAEIIRGTIQAAGAGGAAPLIELAFFDRYTGKGVPEGTVSLSVRLTFQAPERTLTDGDVQDSMDRILAALVREHRAVQR
jgi:phenylalanyl-tRNA synthetase beta chain